MGVPLPSNGGTGIRLGRYELLRRLGAGGMAEVHLARTSGIEGFEKLVVVKRILPHHAADPEFIRMFLVEARLAAFLDHPNVVQVHDLGCESVHGGLPTGGDYYFAMEFVYGENLQSIVQAAAGRADLLPIEHGVRICIDVAAGLHYAHERVGFDGKPLGIVHRDVSPSNVLVTYDGTAKVADFGIAKVTLRTDVTRAGIRKGKVPYMSPEQCRADPLDPRSDVFALGIILYECTTLTRLFDGDNDFGMMNRIVRGDIPLPSTRRHGYPAELERIVMKALAIDRDQRYSSARALQLELQRFARDRRLDVAASALASWMHRVFRPQPFPWGALVTSGDVPRPAVSYPVTETPPPIMLPQRTGQGPEVHAGSGPVPPSYASPVSAASQVSRSHVSHASQIDLRSRTIGPARGIAMGLGLVAGVAVIGVAGTFAGLELARSEASLREAATSVLGGESDAATADAEVVPKASVSDPAAAKGSVASEAEVQPGTHAARAPEEEGADADPGSARVDPSVTPDLEAPPEAEANVDEEEIVMIDEPDPASVERDGSGESRPSTPRPRTSKPREKASVRPNLDAFMPGGGQ